MLGVNSGPFDANPECRVERVSVTNNDTSVRESNIDRFGIGRYEVPLLDENMIDIFIAGQKYVALVDSGAGLNVVSQAFVKKLPIHLRNKFQTEGATKCYLADGSETPTLGTIVLPVSINRQCYSQKFSVFQKTNSEIILGTPFLKHHKANIRYDTLTLELASEIPVYTQTHVVIPPRSEVLLPAQLSNPVPDHIEGECETFKPINAKGLFLANIAVCPRNNQIPVRVYNCTNVSKTLKANERVATYCPWPNEVTISGEEEKVKVSEISQVMKSKRAELKPTPPKVDLSSDLLNDEQRGRLRELVNEFADCFVHPQTNELGLTNILSHKIEIKTGAQPVHKYPYRMNPSARKTMDDIVQEQLRQGLIEETFEGEWASPQLLVRKANGAMRLVIDYRGLNAVTIPQVIRIPRIDDIIDTVGQGKPKYFSCFDLQSGFHQVPLDAKSRKYTAFTTHSGKYRYRRLPMGLRNAPSSFSALVEVLLRGISYKYVVAYIDDICCFSPTFESHLEHLREIFVRLRQANLKLKPKKCAFAKDKIKYLGHIVSSDGIATDPDKI